MKNSTDPQSLLRFLGEDPLFPAFANAHLEYVGAQLKCFREKKFSALSINVLWCMQNAFGSTGLANQIYTVTNYNGKWESDAVWVRMIRESAHQQDFTGPMDHYLKPSVKSLTLRWKAVSLDGLAEFAKENPKAGPRQGKAFSLTAIGRYLIDRQRKDVLASDAEIQAALPQPMAEVLHVDEWRHPDVRKDELPVEIDSFHQLAQSLCSNDIPIDLMEESSNTDWRNWSR
ncbi:MAG: hypothetical protein Q8K78_16840 [Planctomycetaceae bacterium]|nr:hypothetical protein [Planctomycetaceae bacterium]